MRKIKLPKKNGKYRLIYMPSRARKRRLRGLLPKLVQLVQQVAPSGVVQGFMPDRNPVTNAWMHICYQHTVCFDLADFFDTVRREHVQRYLSKKELALVFVDGAPRQGLPTSPQVANLAAATRLDWELKELAERYTRYADDLTFSFDDPQQIPRLLEKVPQVVASCGFRVNPSKTHVQHARNGRRHITGVAVDHDVHPTRRLKRRIRAARFNDLAKFAAELPDSACVCWRVSPPEYARAAERLKTWSDFISNHTRGLMEWAECSFPRQFEAHLQQPLEQQDPLEDIPF